jgi:hypothetical protein
VTSSSCPDRRRRAFLLAAVLLWASPAHAQKWRWFASGSSFGTVEMSNVPLLTEGSQTGTDAHTGFTAGATGGVRWTLPRNNGALAYGVGVATFDGVDVGPDNVVQYFQGQNSTRIGNWWHLELNQGFYWGVLQVEQDLNALRLGGLPSGNGEDFGGPAGGQVQGPRSPTPVQASNPALAPGATAATPGTSTGTQLAGGDALFAIHEVRYVRTSSTAGITYDRGLWWATGLTLAFDLQHFLEDAPFVQRTREGRLIILPLVDTWQAAADYRVEYRASEVQRFYIDLSARTLWFIEHPISAELAAIAKEENAIGTDGKADTTVNETAGGRLGWNWDFAPDWNLDADAGAEVLIPLDNPSDRRTDAVGMAGVGYRVNSWQFRAQVSRDISASELGAVYATSSAALGARGMLMPRIQAQLWAIGARQDVLRYVLAENETEDDINLRQLEGWSVSTSAQLDFLISKNLVATASYALDQRFSDDPATDTLLSHRILVGLTLGTDGAQVASGVGGGGGVSQDEGLSY